MKQASLRTMRILFYLCGFLICGLAVADDRPSKAASKARTAMREVLKLIRDLEGKVMEEHSTEAANYEHFQGWCKDEIDSAQRFIEEVDGEKTEKNAAAAAAKAAANAAEKRAARLAGEISAKENEVKSAETTRGDARSADEKNLETLAQTIRALEVAGDKAKDIDTRRVFRSLEVSVKSKYEMMQGDAAANSENDGAEEGMKTEVQTLTKEMNIAKDEVNEQRQLQTKALQAAHELDVMKLKKQQAIKDVQYQCDARASEWKCRSKARADEVNGLREAQKVIEKNFFSGLAQTAAVSLLQFGSRQERSGGTARQVASPNPLSLLQTRDDSTISDAGIAELQKAAARGDPMGKVTSMVKQMLKKLLDEAAQEKGNHEWCMQTMENTKADHSSSLRKHTKLSNRVKAGQVELAKIAKSIKEFSTSLEELEKKAKEAADARRADHAQFEKSSEDGSTAEMAIKQAIRVLGDYKAERDRSLLQVVHGGAAANLTVVSQRGTDQLSGQVATDGADVGGPWAGGKARNAQRGEASQMILDIMDMTLTDFQKARNEEEQAEQAAQRDYEKYVQDVRVEKATLRTNLKNLLDEQNYEKKKVSEATQDSQEAQDKLNEVIQYLAALEKKCGPKKDTYEERMQRREKQIKSLQDALESLNVSR